MQIWSLFNNKKKLDLSQLANVRPDPLPNYSSIRIRKLLFGYQ